MRKRFAYMGKLFKKIGIVATAIAILRAAWGVVSHIGNFQTLWGLVKDWPTYLKYAALVVGSVWFPVAIAVLCLIAWWLLSIKERRKEEKQRGLMQPQSSESNRHRIIDGIRTDAGQYYSQLQIACDSSVEGCVVEAQWTINHEPLPVKFFRVAVNAVGKDQSIKHCTGFLRRIEKDGKTKWGGNNAQLTFAQGEEPDALSKTIRHPVPEYLDILVVTSRNQISPGTKPSANFRGWPFVPRMDEIFSEIGEYVLTVAITGDGVPTVTALLKFTWTQNWQTAALTLIPKASIQPAPRLTNPEIELQSDPLQVEALQASPRTENKTQLGWTMKGKPTFHGDCILSIQNPNLTQGITGVGFRLLSIKPALLSARGFDPMTEDQTLRCIKFPIDDIRDNILRGGQKGHVRVFTATRKPFAEPQILENITVQFGGEWPIESRKEFTPQSEHILSVEASGDGLQTTVTQFKASFSAKREEPVFTLTKLPE
jgi:hypothetical protein